MRGNPLDNKQGPDVRRPMIVVLGALILLAGAGWAAHDLTAARREANVARAVLAQGYGKTLSVAPIKGDECWRAREGYRWRTQKTQGWACAGPGSEVTLHLGEPGNTWP